MYLRNCRILKPSIVKKNLVIIPTYNERENIESIIEAVLSQPIEALHILIIDDNSPDGTASLVMKLQKSHEGRIHLIQRPGKLGLGTAYITGFKWALEQQYDFIFEKPCLRSVNIIGTSMILKPCFQVLNFISI